MLRITAKNGTVLCGSLFYSVALRGYKLFFFLLVSAIHFNAQHIKPNAIKKIDPFRKM
jgi:hypothetical protein